MSDYDVIVIGAGNAGLTAATTLQRAGARTLLLERHNVPGGCATSFRRGRFEFEVALHQLSGVGVPGQDWSLRELFADLGVADDLEFVEERELYRALVPGVVDFTLPADRAGAADAIEAAFPGNGARARELFDLIERMTVARTMAMQGAPVEAVDPVLFRLGLRPTKDVLDDHFGDPALTSALGMYWSYLGQPPSRLPFQEFAELLYVYFDFKPMHLRGGSQALSSALLRSFLAAGGEVRFHSEVDRIVVSGGRVAGVRLGDGQEIGARDVVSNASLPTTYAMLGDDLVPAAVRRDLGTRRIGVSAFGLHVGLHATPAELGIRTATTFVSRDTDDDRTYAGFRTLDPAHAACVTCYDVDPIGFSPAGASHLSILTLQYASAWDGVAPRDYARTKFTHAESLLDLAELAVPGVRDAIEEVDVYTPRTLAHYLGHPGGAIYGYDQDVTETWLFRDPERLPQVPGLHLAGSWATAGGFQPTLSAGADVARRLLDHAA